VVTWAKYQAMGNDYLIVEPTDDWSPGLVAAQALCDRHFGVGADGVVFGPLGTGGDGAIVVRIYNSDGSPCERSANGLRAFALRHVENFGERQSIDTGFGRTEVHVTDIAAGHVAIDLGTPEFDAAAIPLLGHSGPAIDHPIEVDSRPMRMTCLNNGNPHAVVMVADVTEALARELGPSLANHNRFPTRVNAEFATVSGLDALRVEVWERGAGSVLASGSGGCAAAAAAHRLGQVGTVIEVIMRGGRIMVRIGERGEVRMSGVVEQVMYGWTSDRLTARIAVPVDERVAPTPRPR
jgi:diaminopimelate epimerase